MDFYRMIFGTREVKWRRISAMLYAGVNVYHHLLFNNNIQGYKFERKYIGQVEAQKKFTNINASISFEAHRMKTTTIECRASEESERTGTHGNKGILQEHRHVVYVICQTQSDKLFRKLEQMLTILSGFCFGCARSQRTL